MNVVANVRRILVALCMVAGLSGCESSDFDVAKASGTVTCGDQSVMMGTVIFTPVGEGELAGKPAIGGIQPDGTFRLTTYEAGDGAVVGKHRVSYTAPEELQDEEEYDVDPDSAEGVDRAAERAAKAGTLRKLNSCGLTQELILEVVAGQDNHFTIELTPGAGVEKGAPVETDI